MGAISNPNTPLFSGRFGHYRVFRADEQEITDKQRYKMHIKSDETVSSEKRLRYSILFMIAISIISLGHTMISKLHVPASLAEHAISKYQKRIETAKPFLKANTIVGYATDDLFDKTINKFDHAYKYTVSSYCIAPILLSDSIHHKTIIGDFHKPFYLNELRQNKLKIIKNLGGGLFILDNVGLNDY